MECGGIEGFGIPFALDRVHVFPPPGDHEIHLAAGFVAPISDGEIGQMGLEIFQDKVFPEKTEIFGAERVPSADEADKPGVEPVNFRLFD